MTDPATVLDALADKNRIALLEALQEGPRPVGELAAALPVSQPAVSQHLRVLREAQLVEATKDGTKRIYRLRPDGFDRIREYLESYPAGPPPAGQEGEPGVDDAPEAVAARIQELETELASEREVVARLIESRRELEVRAAEAEEELERRQSLIGRLFPGRDK